MNIVYWFHIFFIKGEKTFFLQPGERLAKGIQDVYVLEEDEGLILRCTESFKEDGVSLFICLWKKIIVFFSKKIENCT